MKAKHWLSVFTEKDPVEAVSAFVAETVSLANSRGKSDAAAESAVREQKTKLRAVGLDPEDLDEWLRTAAPELYEKYRRGHGRRAGCMAVNKFGLAGRKPARRRKPAMAR